MAAAAKKAAATPVIEGHVDVKGTVTHVLFRADDSGYTVFKLDSGMVATGQLPNNPMGKRVHLIGEEVAHPKYGKQVKSTQVTVIADGDVGMIRYLASGRFPNIGEAMARGIVEEFGAKTREVIENSPALLKKVPGVGKARIATLHKIWGLPEIQAEAPELVFLLGLGLTPPTADKLRVKYAPLGGAAKALTQNPYRLLDEVDGFGFKRADAVATGLGIDGEDPFRIAAGLRYVVELFEGQGYCSIPRLELETNAAKLLGVTQSGIAQGMATALQNKVVLECTVKGEACIARPYLHRMEGGIAERMLKLAHGQKFEVADLEQRVAKLEEEYKVVLHPEQRTAVMEAVRNPVTIITGGPGTGKSTITRFILKIYQDLGLYVVMAAPTGKAAVRQSEVAGDLLPEPARTLHRLLEAGKDGEFARNRHNPLEAEVVIVDEPSMLDVPLAYRLMEAMPLDARLVMTGDVDQLPSVGPGKVLADLISSGALPVCWLTKVYRQAAQSPIWLAAQQVREGNGEAALAEADGKFFAVQMGEPDDAAQLVLDAVATYAAEGLDPIREIQVMTAGHNGSAGTINLNKRLQAALNPAGRVIPYKDGELRVGDKVLQTVNDYDIHIVNGDTGVITGWQANGADVFVEIDFGSRTVWVPPNKLRRLRLAYAMTVHKMQGSEVKAAIVVLSIQHFMLLKRNLLYTAMTRGKGFVSLVTDSRAYGIAIKSNPVEERWTKLGEWLASPANASKAVHLTHPAPIPVMAEATQGLLPF